MRHRNRRELVHHRGPQRRGISSMISDFQPEHRGARTGRVSSESTSRKLDCGQTKGRGVLQCQLAIFLRGAAVTDSRSERTPPRRVSVGSKA